MRRCSNLYVKYGIILRQQRYLTYLIVVLNRLISFVFQIIDGMAPRIIFDKSVSVRQLSVVEPHGLLILRTDKGKYVKPM